MEHNSPGQSFIGKDEYVKNVFQLHGELSTASLAQPLDVFHFGSLADICLGILWALSVVYVGYTQVSVLFLCP